MDKPTEDGYLILTLAHPLWRVPVDLPQDNDAYYVRYDFKDIDGIQIDPAGIRVLLQRASKSYPWTSIVEHHHVYNSEAYIQALTEYQEQHTRNWVCTNEYNATHTPPGFYWYCGPAKDGSDDGCSKSEYREKDDMDRTIEDVRKFMNEMRDFGDT